MPDTFRNHLVTQLRECIRLYAEDIEALPVEALSRRPNEATRSPLDITEELIVVTDRFVIRLEGGDPGPWPFTGTFVRAQESVDAATSLARLKASTERAIEALGDDPFRVVGTTPVYEWMLFLITHASYHDGQLNYIQTLGGDDKMNWTF